MDKKKQEEKQYAPPKIKYVKRIETLAAVCDSTWVGPSASCCMTAGCQKRAT